MKIRGVSHGHGGATGVGAESPGKYLICGSACEAPSLLHDVRGKVALAVTSPPYHNAISYDSHAADARENYRKREALSYAGEYLPFLDEVWAACYEMLCPGGHLAVNVGSVLLNGYQYPVPQDITIRLLEAAQGWEYVRTIIWHKVTAGVKRAGSVIRHALPGYWYPNILTEQVILVRKPGPARLQTNVPPEWLSPVWEIAPVSPGQIPHPAPFPEELPHRLVRMLTIPGECVYDPFMGSGATAKAAFDLGRVPAGLDIQPQYVEYAKHRLGRPTLVRPRQLRIEVKLPADFVPKPSRGRTRHGAGLRDRAS
jgi:site-specific DNA-methyltransferase (adenine-specific)